MVEDPLQFAVRMHFPGAVAYDSLGVDEKTQFRRLLLGFSTETAKQS